MTEADLLDPAVLLGAAAIMFLGGFVKGVVGFALPMVAVAGIGSFATAQQTLALLILPIFLSNLWQTLRQGFGPAVETGRRFWKMIAILAVLIALVAQIVPGLAPEVMFLALGSIVSLAAMLQLAGWRPVAPRGRGARLAVELATGVVAGICGGLSGVWGPPVVFFLVSLQLARTDMMRAQGLTYFVGACVLLGAHLGSGLANAETLPLSALMCVPAAVGMGVGLRLQDRLDPDRFRRAILVVLCLAGLNLLRRGLV